MKKVINLKKYANRKLYSPKGEFYDYGAYVNLRDVETKIKEGYDIKVTDNIDGVDVTENILRSIVSEMESSPEKLIKFIRA